jgi:tetratricopeptide (TPR) repeat protein
MHGEEQERHTTVPTKNDEARVKTREHETKVRTKAHEPILPPEAGAEMSAAEPEKSKAPAKKSTGIRGTYQELLADAWKAYTAQSYSKAKHLFQNAIQSKDMKVANEALLGLGYTLKNMGEHTEARAILEQLVAKNYRTEETILQLLELLFAAKDWEKSEALLQKLSPEERQGWREKFEGLKFQAEFEKVKKSSDEEQLVSFVEAHQHLLKQCKFSESFYVTALEVSKSGAERKALGIFRQLLACNPRNWDFRIKVFRELISLLAFDTASAELTKEHQRPQVPTKYQARLAEVEIQLLKRRLSKLDASCYEYRTLSNRLVALDPHDQDTRKGLAWNCYRAEEYQCALENFSSLYASDPQKEEYLLGYCYTLEKLGRTDRAISLLESWEKLSSPEIVSAIHRLYRQKGDASYKEKNYAKAEYYLTKALEIDPGDKTGKNLLGWSRYQQGDFDGALSVFRETYRVSKSPEWAENALIVLEKEGNHSKTSEFLFDLAGEESPALRKIAADRFYLAGEPIKAAQTFKGSDACYYNCDTPWAELFGYYRNRDGDSGFSKLTEVAFPFRFHYPTVNGREWVAGVTSIFVDAGDVPAEPFAGKFYSSLDTPGAKGDSFEESVWVWEPEVRYHIEGPVKYEFRLGATPLGGAVDPMVTFFAEASKKDSWHVNVHQCSVDESILSYVGQRDPYGDQDWGRVLKTGIKGSKTFALVPPYWFSVNLGYDYYWGKNVKENYSIFGTASAGRSETFRDGYLSYGLFFSTEHFERNTDFFTFGHGGYFSPNVFYISGPFLQYKTGPCRDYWFDGQISLGYMYYKTEDAPHYHKTDDHLSALNQAALNEFNAEFEGESESDLGISAKFQGLRYINDRVAVGGAVSLDTTSEYTEWQALLTLRLYFQPRIKFCAARDLFNTIRPYF